MRRPAALLATAVLLGACGRGRPAAPPAPQPVPRCASSSPSAWPGMHATLTDSMRALLERAAHDSAFPGAYAIVGRHDRLLASVGVGCLDWTPSPAPDARTLWDLASLTKVVGTTSAIMQLVAEGHVALDAPVHCYLPEWTGDGKELVTIRHLLTHSSGLPAWRPLYKEAEDTASALRLVYETPLDTVPGARMVYSDLGAILLGEVVRRVSNRPLDGYLQERVFAPLLMESTGFRPPAALAPYIAPTEVDAWRQRHLRGEVHDENAYALGGVAGHAGLFSSALDLERFARMYLNGGMLDTVRILDSATIATFTTVQDRAFSSRALGWDTPTGTNSAGTRMSPRAFGHTGFTGTSLWIDPEHDVFVLLLTNRVNPSRMNTRIGAVRIALADLVMTQLGTPPSTATHP